MTSDPDCDTYFANATDWADEQRLLRSILQRTPLVEAYKWRQPVYTHNNTNLVTIWAFAEHCGLGFFRGVLLSDPEKLLLPVGPNSRSACKMTFESAAEIEAAEPVIVSYVDEAIARDDAGEKVEFAKDDLDYPDELVEALAADPELAAAWDDLTPGRRRGHVLHIAGAKQSATRSARIDRNRDKILAGKGFQGR